MAFMFFQFFIERNFVLFIRKMLKNATMEDKPDVKWVIKGFAIFSLNYDVFVYFSCRCCRNQSRIEIIYKFFKLQFAIWHLHMIKFSYYFENIR